MAVSGHLLPPSLLLISQPGPGSFLEVGGRLLQEGEKKGKKEKNEGEEAEEGRGREKKMDHLLLQMCC